MSHPLVSVVMASYNRAHLLRRSIEGYNRSSFPLDQLEIIVIDDHSSDDTRMMMGLLHPSIRWMLVTVGPKNEQWRDCGAVLNAGIRASLGDYIILTHPEVIPGRDSISECVKNMYYNMYTCCKIYYLSQAEQELINIVSDKRDTLAIRKIPNFYSQDTNGNPDYRHDTTDKIGTPGFRLQTWESWVFGGLTRTTWKWLGGMLETQKWGSVDVGFLHRRKVLGIPNHTCIPDSTICIHQNHDSPNDIQTPRIESEWQRELATMPLNDVKSLTYPAINYLGW
jgi:Glycosyl transferase family 2